MRFWSSPAFSRNWRNVSSPTRLEAGVATLAADRAAGGALAAERRPDVAVPRLAARHGHLAGDDPDAQHLGALVGFPLRPLAHRWLQLPTVRQAVRWQPSVGPVV